VKALDPERKGRQQRFDHRQQVGLGEFLAAGHQLPLRDAIHGVDVVQAFQAVLIALMHAVDADKARAPLGLRGLAYADRHRGGAGLVPLPAPIAIARSPAQVVQVRHRNTRQARVARIAVDLQGAHQQPLGGRPRERTVQRVGLGQHHHVLLGVQTGKPMCRPAVAFDQGRPFQGTLEQPRHLRSRVPRGMRQIAPHQALVRPPEPAVAKAAQHRSDVLVACPIVSGRLECHPGTAIQKRLQLRQRFQLRIVHVDHHVRDDRRPAYSASGSYLVGNTAPDSGSYHVG